MKIDFSFKNYKLYLLQKNLREKGFYSTFKEKIAPYLLRPIDNLIKRYRFLIEIFYGIFPDLKKHFPLFQTNSRMLKVSKGELVESVRRFWYLNTPGEFILDGQPISRKEIFVYGGPNSDFSCSICQKSEWLSRIKQKNLFITHSCATSERCKILCSRQGDELWTHFHQDFTFSLGCDPNLPAPKGLYILFGEIAKFFAFRPEPMERILRRQFAYGCQLDLAEKPVNINWENYDFVFIYHPGCIPKFPRPAIPVILFGHDFWPLENKGYQWVIDWLKPNVLLTTYPTQWRENFKFSPQTKIVFHPMFPSVFFSRPNLNQKSLDLLVIGNTIGPIYEPRRTLNKQVSQLVGRYKIEFSYGVGALSLSECKTYEEDFQRGLTLRYLNKWSEYLGQARYVTFGRMKYPILLGKYYESLGSGAIPIFPEVPDLKLLNIRPFEHYIPLAEIEGNNQRLTYFLDHYEKFKYIAKNAVGWYKENSDRMLFENFENLISEVTNYKFPKRSL